MADYAFADRAWAIEVRFPDQPKTDGILTPSPQGEVKVQRFYWEPGNEHYLIARFEYPLALRSGQELELYAKSFAEMLRARPGQVRASTAFTLGPYTGERRVIAHQREKSVREVRFIAVGAVLYLASAEWPEEGRGADRAAQFFAGLQVREELADPLMVAERDRWRELGSGCFRLRYDATCWYRDPTDADPGVFNLLRADQRAEAQFIAEPETAADGDIGEAVLATARAGAESVQVLGNGRKRRGNVEVVELKFAARVGQATFRNHGYFYSGPEGIVQLRGWAEEKQYGAVEGDISELLDGLAVTKGKQNPK